MRKLALGGSLLSLALLFGCGQQSTTPAGAPEPGGGPKQAAPAEKGKSAEPAKPESSESKSEPKAEPPSEKPE